MYQSFAPTFASQPWRELWWTHPVHHTEAAQSVFVEFIRLGEEMPHKVHGCREERQVFSKRVCLYELPGFHNPVLLHGDLGMSGLARAIVISLTILWPHLPAVPRGSFVLLQSILA